MVVVPAAFILKILEFAFDSSMAVSPQDLALNAPFFRHLEECKSEVGACPTFQNVELRKPESKFGRGALTPAALAESTRGSNVTDGKVSFTTHGPVNTNIFCLTWSGSDGVPVNRANVDKLIAQRLSTPAEAKGQMQEMRVGFMKGDLQHDNIPSNIKILSAEELNYALLLRIWQRVDALAPTEELEEWLELCCNYPVVWECHDGPESMRWRSINIREDYSTSFDLLSRSAVQKLFELMAFKHAEEKKKSMSGTKAKTTQLTAKTLYNLWSANVKFSTLSTGKDRAGGQEMEFSISFVEACLFTYNRVLAFESPRNSVLQAEDCASNLSRSFAIVFFLSVNTFSLWAPTYLTL